MILAFKHSNTCVTNMILEHQYKDKSTASILVQITYFHSGGPSLWSIPEWRRQE